MERFLFTLMAAWTISLPFMAQNASAQSSSQSDLNSAYFDRAVSFLKAFKERPISTSILDFELFSVQRLDRGSITEIRIAFPGERERRLFTVPIEGEEVAALSNPNRNYKLRFEDAVFAFCGPATTVYYGRHGQYFEGIAFSFNGRSQAYIDRDRPQVMADGSIRYQLRGRGSSNSRTGGYDFLYGSPQSIAPLRSGFSTENLISELEREDLRQSPNFRENVFRTFERIYLNQLLQQNGPIAGRCH